MGDVALIWSAMGGMFTLFIGYVVWDARQHNELYAKMKDLEGGLSLAKSEMKRECADANSRLKEDIQEKISEIDKKQDVEFAKINTQLEAIKTQNAATQTQLSDVARLLAAATSGNAHQGN